MSLPSIGVHLQPLAPTGEFAPPMLRTGSWGAVGNRIAGHAVNLAVERVFAATVPEVRGTTGTASRQGPPHAVVGAGPGGP
ncbi:hypothetical protein [Streptomyces dysideae]